MRGALPAYFLVLARLYDIPQYLLDEKVSAWPPGPAQTAFRAGNCKGVSCEATLRRTPHGRMGKWLFDLTGRRGISGS